MEQLRQINRQVINIIKDLGGELARSSEFCNVLMDEFQCGLQTTGGHSSWLNSKSEMHISTIENTSRKIRGDTSLPAKLWCFSYEHMTNILGALIHDATDESPDFFWYGTHRSIHDFIVWGCHMEAMKVPHSQN